MKKEFVETKREDLLARVREIASGPHRLSVISGADNGGKLEVLYTFDLGEKVLTLRVALEKDDARIPSISPLVPAATLYEREFAEMFGIALQGHPSPGRLFLPDNFKGAPPLLKQTPGGSSD